MAKLITPSGRVGEVLPDAFRMPLHTLLKFEDGTTRWILTELLTPAPRAKATKKTKRRTTGKKAA